MTETERTARKKLGAMLTRLWMAAGQPQAQELGLPPSTLRDWRKGETAPERTDHFRSVVRKLQQAAGHPIHTDTEWEVALRAAQQEGTSARHRQIVVVRERDPRHRFVRPHRPAVEAAVDDVRGREGERRAMNAFVTDPRSTAPSYLCWHADAPVGKTVLLADYVQRPPHRTDILNFFVSAAHGTDTRTAFEQQMADQIGAFVRSPQQRMSGSVQQWKRLFAAAAEKSMRHGRKLLLVVDGLDDDVAWSGLAADGAAPTAGGRSTPNVVRGSIAALLPAAPPPGMRVIVSFRRGVRPPDDLPTRHPLRQRTHLRALAPVEGVPQVRLPPPDPTALGETVAGLLAAAGGGLRTADLAELTGRPADRLDRLVQGPAGRSLILDDPVAQTYALAAPGLIQAIHEGLGDEAIARHTRALLGWSQRWRTAGWPPETPPYPLTHQLRLLTGAAERAAYVLDMPRLRRLASTAGPGTALAQLDALEEEISPSDTSPGSLAVLVPLIAARTLLRRESREVPPGAPALLVRLGEVERARGLARSAPTMAARAVHLAAVAVEMTYAEREGADAVALEAAQWLTRNDQGFPGTYQDTETYTRLLEAARTLVSLNDLGAARTLLRAVIRNKAAGTDALTEAAGLLVTANDAWGVTALRERAENLSEGGTRDRAAAVDLWGALARAMPSLSSDAGDRIMAICEELDPSDGLDAVDVLARAASALARLPTRRHRVAHEKTQTALARMTEALADPDALSEDDQAHLGRELAGTLARLAQAVDDTMPPTRNALEDIGRLLKALPETLRVGVLGDAIAERALFLTEASEERRAQEAHAASAAAREEKNAIRRNKDAERKALAVSRRKDTNTRTEPGGTQSKARSAPATQRAPRHRMSTGLRLPDNGPRPDHVLLLHEADDQLDAGNLLRSRELLETALRRSRVASSHPTAPGDWTVHLSQALGLTGEFSTVEALAADLPGAPDRALHLAALSLGCSLGGHTDAGGRYAHEAARLTAGNTDPGLTNLVAQALAHAGDASAASATATGRTATEKRQALTAVAAGLARHCPEEAARIAEPLTEALVRRIDAGSPFRTLPELAALLLAYPDIRQPDPRLHEAFRLASVRLSDTSPQWHTPSMTVLTLLKQLGCLPRGNSHVVAGMTDRWRRSLQPGQEPCAVLALLSAMDGDTTALWRHTEAARTPDGRAMALYAAAAYLAGTPVTLATDSRAGDRLVRTCLALARTTGDGSPPAEATARRLVRGLLRTDAWAHTIPLLPQLAPSALRHLSLIARHPGPRAGGPETGGITSDL
ncbi:hypothetical protein [Streptomyces heilongjiangensis]|uniref:NACHT domain-containing protein n=1 Tax=Streptomyces heilongjiangensis TaxID=945052 RepID=A0ABW1BJQ7_9ACTN|nr:hypothetical protein [Streptomyces heilongjiangensis]MDC2952632.1 hypothetical protein [Streptomyces heilongjiangensis]